MTINKNSLQALINRLAKERGVHANVLLVTFFFDAFIVRLAKSPYARKLVFKGGFYLATMLGVQNRYTADIDFLLIKENLDAENLRYIFDKILNTPAQDPVSFEIVGISPIRNTDAYGGFSVLLTGHLENIRQSFHVDIATGDPVTPSAVEYVYRSLLGNEEIKFKAYNLETVIAEKIQTILSRGVLNSRSKDFYDVYIIQKLRKNEVDMDLLKKAFEKTCSYRKTPIEKFQAAEIVNEISQNEIMRTRWKNYAKKSSFAKGISFDEVVKSCKDIVERLGFLQ